MDCKSNMNLRHNTKWHCDLLLKKETKDSKNALLLLSSDKVKTNHLLNTSSINTKLQNDVLNCMNGKDKNKFLLQSRCKSDFLKNHLMKEPAAQMENPQLGNLENPQLGKSKRLLSESLKNKGIKRLKLRALQNDENVIRMAGKKTKSLRLDNKMLEKKDLAGAKFSTELKHGGTEKKKKLTTLKLPVCEKTFDDGNMPVYSFDYDTSADFARDISQFLANEPLEQMKKFEDVQQIETKKHFLNAVSCSLVSSSNMKNRRDVIRCSILEQATVVMDTDPEFILKVALYAREELNMRTPANLLLAFSAFQNDCRPFLRKYFNRAVRLPSDWIEVALLHQTFLSSSNHFGTFPSVLRKAMIEKFPEFDAYQLAKYNKVKKPKPKRKPQVSRDEDMPKTYVEALLGDLETDEANEIDEEDCTEAISFTFKMLIRRLHITRPADYVMSLIGKKYPQNISDFQRSGLLGVWNEQRAGQRMKLPIPETWETQVALNGNKMWVWQELIDNKKLPFMAMLRNIRNMIFAGISKRHHDIVLRTLSNEESVARSRQFPYRFFSAFEALKSLDDALEKAASENLTTDAQANHNSKRGNQRRGKKKAINFDSKIIQNYRVALNEAVRLATVRNMATIRGRTLVFCNAHWTLSTPCTTAKGLGRPRTIIEMGILVGLMCQYICESCQLFLFGSEKHKLITHSTDAILTRLESLLEEIADLNGSNNPTHKFPIGILDCILRDHQQINNIILLTSSTIFPEVNEFLKAYRTLVNPELLFVVVDLSATKCQIETSLHVTKDQNSDIYLSGFSDQLLRFISEKGSDAQIQYVENIDMKYKLNSGSHENVKKNLVKEIPEWSSNVLFAAPKWRSLKIFISSTFLDMHAERDLLVRYIFPELRRRAQPLFLEINEIDLRWGISEQDVLDNMAVKICLQEARKCDIFVGFLGERYGNIPQPSQIPDTEEFDWATSHLHGASVTELEFYGGALNRQGIDKDRALFCIRSNAFLKDVPLEYKLDFISESDNSYYRLQNLKEAVRASAFQIYDGYPCTWGGVVKHKPIVGGLHELGEWLLDHLWNSVVKFCPQSDDEMIIDEDEFANDTLTQNTFVSHRCKNFVMRQQLVDRCLKEIEEKNTQLLILSGKSGCGKTSLMSYLYENLNTGSHHVIAHFAEASSRSSAIANMLQRFCREIATVFKNDVQVSSDFHHLIVLFHKLLESVHSSEDRITFFIDGLDEMSNSSSFNWLPEILPKNVMMICSVNSDTDAFRNLMHKTTNPVVINVNTLTFSERTQMIQQLLALHGKCLNQTLLSNQVSLLASKRDAGRPLYLTLVCNDIRLHGTFDQMNDFLHKFPSTLDGFLHAKLDNICQQYGTEMVWLIIGSLFLIAKGLTEEELYSILQLGISKGFLIESAVKIDDDPFAPKRVPRAMFGKLLMDLFEFLKPTDLKRDSNLTFAHGEIAAEAWKYFQKKRMTCAETYLHSVLSTFYREQADPLHNFSWLGHSLQAFSSLVQHYIAANNLSEAANLLTDIRFLYGKCRRGLNRDLLQDYIAFEQSLPLVSHDSRYNEVQTFKIFVIQNQHLLKVTPSLIFQQALNNTNESSLCREGLKLLRTPYMKTAMQWLNKPSKQSIIKKMEFKEVVTCVEASTCGKYLSLGMESGIVVITEAKTVKEVQVLMGHMKSITAMCFVGNAKFCSASLDSTLCLWDIQTGVRYFTMNGHVSAIMDCCSNTEGTSLMSVGLDGNLCIWNVYTGQAMTVKKEKCPINCAALHPYQSLAVIGLWDATIRIWDLITLKRRAVTIHHSHSTSVTCLGFSPCGDYIASGSLCGEIIIWSTLHGVQILGFPRHTRPINKIQFVNSESFVTVSDDCSMQVWHSIFSKTREAKYNEDLKEKITCLEYCWGSFAVVGLAYSEIKLINFTTGKVEFSACPIKSSITALAVSEDRSIVVGYSNGMVAMFDKENKLCTWNTYGGAITSLLCTKDKIVSGSADGMLHFKSLHHKSRSENDLKAHSLDVTKIVLHPSESIFVTISKDKSMKIWWFEKQCVELLGAAESCHNDWITSCAWFIFNDANYVVTGSADGYVKLWITKENFLKISLVKIIGSFSSPVHMVYALEKHLLAASTDGIFKTFTHKGYEVASTSTSKNMHITQILSRASTKLSWHDQIVAEETKNEHQSLGKIYLQPTKWLAVSDRGTLLAITIFPEAEVHCLSGHSKPVTGTTLLRDSQLVTCAKDKTVCISDVNIKHQTSMVHKSEIIAIKHSVKISVLITGSRDGYITVWNGSSDDVPIKNFSMQAHSNAVNAICFVRESDLVYSFATGSNDCCLRLWSVHDNTMKLKGNVELSLPVLCLDFQANGNIIAAGGWQGTIWICDTNTCEIVGHFNGSPSAWMIGVTLFSRGFDLLIALDNRGNILLCTMLKMKEGKVKIQLDKKFNYQAEETGFSRCLYSLFNHSLNEDRYHVLIGSSMGSITEMKFDESFNLTNNFYQPFNTIVLACAFNNKKNLVFTSSTDCLLKVWCMMQGITLKQVGQFECAAPVTSIAELETNIDSDTSIRLACGDSHGNIYFLRWLG